MTAPVRHSSIDVYLSGKRLYGDDFTQDEIADWFADEAEGYFGLVQSEKKRYSYGYHALNMRHGFAYLPKRRFAHVLGIGSAFGEELTPILERSDQISILEPADGFKLEAIRGVPVTYVHPHSSGILPFPTNSIDLITCLGVLHHIPNVGTVLNECFRVLKSDGYALVREPIISMGDWRKPRRGLTKRERGIPLPILRNMAEDAGFKILNESKCMFSLTSRLRHVLRGPVYNNRLAVALDDFLCRFPYWADAYHARSAWQKLRASSIFLVLIKKGIEIR